MAGSDDLPPTDDAPKGEAADSSEHSPLYWHRVALAIQLGSEWLGFALLGWFLDGYGKTQPWCLIGLATVGFVWSMTRLIRSVLRK